MAWILDIDDATTDEECLRLSAWLFSHGWETAADVVLGWVDLIVVSPSLFHCIDQWGKLENVDIEGDVISDSEAKRIIQNRRRSHL